MNRCRHGALLILLALAMAGNALAQSGSANFKLTAGWIAAGGGGASSASFNNIGQVPLTTGASSEATTYKMFGGVIGAFSGAAAFTAGYAGAADQVVPIAAMTLKVAFVGGAGTATGAFFYRIGGETPWQQSPMTAGTGDTLVFPVTTTLLTLRGLEYYFFVQRGANAAMVGSAVAPYVFRVQLTNAQGLRPIALPDAQYRIIGLPVVATSNTMSGVFVDDLGAANKTLWRLGRYEATLSEIVEYPPDSRSVTPGTGFWLIARGGKKYGSAGVSVYPNREYGGANYYEAPLDSGWNEIANPFPFGIAWSDVLFDDNGAVVAHLPSVLDDAAYSYTGTGYSAITTIPGWDGVFVKIKKRNVKALYPYVEAGQTLARSLKEFAASPSPENWNINVALEAGGLVDDGNLAGVRPDALPGEDNYDFSDPPPAPDGPSLAFRMTDIPNDPKRIDFRAPFADGATWTLAVSKAPGRQLTITGVYQIPQGMKAVLIPEDGLPVTLTENIRIPLSDNVASARLLIGTEVYLAGEVSPIPTDYALYQNYPNPFNPTTTIRFALPTAGHVRLEVYNILGQIVETLIDDNLGVGYHTLVWDGDDAMGRPVASGIYFYRVVSGNYTQSRKMVLVK